jgi:hypothetical protein
MINLLLEKQIKNLVFGKLSDSDDFEDWLKCVGRGRVEKE